MLYFFVVKVTDDNTRMVSTRLDGWQYIWLMSVEIVLTIWYSSLLEDATLILSV